MVAQLRPRPDVPAAVRKLPDRLGAPPPVSARPAVPVTPLAPSRYKLQLTIDRTTQEKLYLVRDLMRHAVPSGDLATILNRALDALLNELERRKLAAAARSRPARAAAPDSRHVPAAVRRAVWARDGGRCAFRGPDGSCGETAFVEFHHVRPFAAGGAATIENIELRCRAHNQYEADLFSGGPAVVRESRAPYRPDAPAAPPWIRRRADRRRAPFECRPPAYAGRPSTRLRRRCRSARAQVLPPRFFAFHLPDRCVISEVPAEQESAKERRGFEESDALRSAPPLRGGSLRQLASLARALPARSVPLAWHPFQMSLIASGASSETHGRNAYRHVSSPTSDRRVG
jgi:hypothetical protein